MPLRMPHHLTGRSVNGLEIDWDDLPHNNLGTVSSMTEWPCRPTNARP
jgi:hypothetical protein